jgi:hypothetical protein
MKRKAIERDLGIQHGPVSRWGLRFSIVGGGVAWTLHLLLSYVAAEFGCILGLDTSRFLGLTAVVWLLAAVTLGSLGLGVWATLVSFSSRKKLRGHERTEDCQGELFTATVGLIANIFFVFVILVQAIPIFYFLREC